MPPSIQVAVDRQMDAVMQMRARGPFLMRLYTFPPGALFPTFGGGGIIEASFPGYAAVPLVENGPPAWDGFSASVLWTFHLVEFVNTGTGVSQLVQGYYVTDSGGAWAWAQQFPSAVMINDPDDGVVIVPRFRAFSLNP